MHRLLLLICVGLACSAPNAEVAVDAEADVVESRSDSIVDGERTNNNENSIVAVLNRAGGLCTGTLIAPRVVLTARHCVQFEGTSGPSLPSQFVIGVGDQINRLSQTYGASEIVTTEGPYRRLQDIIGRDIAVITLTTQPPLEPIPVSRESAMSGQMMRAVGFGEIPDGSAGVKYRTTTRVSFTDGGVIYTPPAICQGDSGGPLLTTGEEELVIGVASFGSGGCGFGTNGYNRIDIWLDLIDEAIRASGVCVGDGTEVCDGEDNDCDELFDEDCTAVGDPCTADDECISLTCRNVGTGGSICTQGCDPQRPMTGCPPGMYCGNAEGCEGFCTPGEMGTLPNDADCTADTDCASLYCQDPGDGRQRCLNPCRGDEGMCLEGEACAAGAGSCSGCVPAEIVVGSRGIGEPCETAEDCVSGFCFEEAGTAYCSRECTEGLDCPAAYHCRFDGEAGVCVRGEAGGVGSTCIANGDCEEGLFCATRGDESWCSAFCEDAMDCPESFSCVMAGDVSVCAPDSGINGAECESGDDCISGNCQPVGPGGSLLCTRFCGPESQCSPGFTCIRSADGITNVCVPTEETASGGGGCAAGGSSGGESFALLLFGLLAFRRRRLECDR